MSNKISGKEYPVSKIFSKEFDFHMPSFQRPYSWEETQVETLFDNLYDFYIENKSDDYFLGSIVLIKKDNSPESEVIDGQQRLTTLTILLSVIAEHLDGNLKATVLNYIVEPGNEIEGIVEKPRLQLRKKDQDFFNKYIQNIKIEELLKLDVSSFENESQQHIKANCEIIKNRLNKYFGDDKEKIKSFCSFIATRCFLVVVSTNSQEAAFRIFSVMNSTGLDLSPSDIIKSEVIGKIDENKQKEYTDKWEDIEIQTTRQGFADLFSHIRMIFMKTKAKVSLLEEFKENVLTNYTPIKLIDEIIEPYAKCYSIIKNKSYESSNQQDAKEINDYFMWLMKTENSDWVPCVIKFMAENKNDSNYLRWFLSKIECLAAYLHITGKDINERINRYSRILMEMEKNPKTNIDNPLSSVQLEKYEKAEFISYLNGDIYCLTSKRRNYVVLRLDSFVGDGAASYSPKILTIEHVLPQTVKPSSQWEKDWPNLQDREKWLNKIANLLPLTRRKNSEAQNFDFNLKKEKYFKSSNGTSSYALTTQVLSANKWDKDFVEKRQAALLNIFKTKWEL